MKYAWIKQQRDAFPISSMYSALRVSRSGYYKWLHAKPSARAQRTSRIRQAVEQVHQESNQIYGSYKIAEKLRQDESLEYACRNTVAKAMKEMGLKSKVSKKFKPNTTVTDPKKRPAPNHLSQVFAASKPNARLSNTEPVRRKLRKTTSYLNR